MCRKIPHENRETPRAAKSSDFALWIETRSLQSLPSWSCINAACAACAALLSQLVRLAQWIVRNVEASLWWWSCSHEKARNLQQSNSIQQLFTGLPSCNGWQIAPKMYRTGRVFWDQQIFQFCHAPCHAPCHASLRDLARSCEDFWDPVTFMPPGSSWPSLIESSAGAPKDLLLFPSFPHPFNRLRPRKRKGRWSIEGRGCRVL